MSQTDRDALIERATAAADAIDKASPIRLFATPAIAEIIRALISLASIPTPPGQVSAPERVKGLVEALEGAQVALRHTIPVFPDVERQVSDALASYRGGA